MPAWLQDLLRAPPLLNTPDLKWHTQPAQLSWTLAGVDSQERRSARRRRAMEVTPTLLYSLTPGLPRRKTWGGHNSTATRGSSNAGKGPGKGGNDKHRLHRQHKRPGLVWYQFTGEHLNAGWGSLAGIWAPTRPLHQPGQPPGLPTSAG